MGQLHAGQLGTGMGIGMTGHHHKYGMSTNLLKDALQNGMSRRDLVKNMMDLKVLMDLGLDIFIQRLRRRQ